MSGKSLEVIAKTYLTQIRDQQAQSHSTAELSYRDYLGQFLRDTTLALGKTSQFTGEAKKIVVGRPDYEVTDGLKIIGYVEAEALDVSLTNLTGSAKSQNERFRQNLYCFLLTNHLDFFLYVGGTLIHTAKLPSPPAYGAVTVSVAALADLETLLLRFLSESNPAARSSEDVARQLAKRARDLRFAADVLLSHDDSPLHSFWNAYKQTLYADLSAEKFADVYAQTFTYGLFLTWLNNDKGVFDRAHALLAIPETVPPIQVLLEFGGGKKLPPEFIWIIDGICADLNAADKEAALKTFVDGRDPIMHFYETFLAAYDPQLRERRGVYYTPDSVVEYIVAAVDNLLQKEFGKQEGLADPSVTLLDPAVGTATFLAHAYRHVHNTLQARGDVGLWPGRAVKHLAKHFYGFELLPAAYTLAHLKLRSLLMELKAPIPDDVRLPVYLTNTLEEGIKQQVALPFTEELIKEAENAALVKSSDNILVVLGNPPYSGHSANPSRNEKGELTFIGALIQDYMKVDGRPLGERNPKWLQDDYVKFLRFAEWRIAKTGQGIVAFITNHGYLDNPTFRGMRQHLMKTFDALYVYDLHGNSKKKERSPDGSKDENVFDIQQGVAICLLVKRPKGGGAAESEVFHADLFGTRHQKYARLPACLTL